MNCLAIGYGNSLRGDDGVGPLVAEQLAAQSWPQVRSQAVHQLTPELAAELATADLVFFIDACLTPAPSSGLTAEAVTVPPQPRLARLTQAESTRCDHRWSPEGVLQLAKALYDAEPVAYHVLIPAVQFDFGETLSAIAEAGVAQAVDLINDLIQNPETPYA